MSVQGPTPPRILQVLQDYKKRALVDVLKVFWNRFAG
jgi:hypothetical protein